MAIMKPGAAMNEGTALIMEVTPVIREAILQTYGNRWPEIAARMLKTTFQSSNDKNDRGLKALADLYSGEEIDGLLREQEMSPEERRGPLVSASIAAYGRGDEITPLLRVDLCLVKAKPTAQSTESGGMFERYKLQPTSNFASTMKRPVPCDGLIVATLAFADGTSQEVRSDPLCLPAQAHEWRDSTANNPVALGTTVSDGSALPASMWLKIGSVQTERAVVQLQLKKAKESRPMWCSPPGKRSDRDVVALHCYCIGSVFISTPMMARGRNDIMKAAVSAAAKEMHAAEASTKHGRSSSEEGVSTSLKAEEKSDASFATATSRKAQSKLVTSVVQVSQHGAALQGGGESKSSGVSSAQTATRKPPPATEDAPAAPSSAGQGSAAAAAAAAVLAATDFDELD